jgi:DNA-binding IclR family transcriptional regulator
VIAAINVAMSAGARTLDEITADVLPALLTASERISDDLSRL